jgi:hypothetical protein
VSQVEGTGVPASESLHEESDSTRIEWRQKQQHFPVEQDVCMKLDPTFARAVHESRHEIGSVAVVDEQDTLRLGLDENQVRLAGDGNSCEASHGYASC